MGGKRFKMSQRYLECIENYERELAALQAIQRLAVEQSTMLIQDDSQGFLLAMKKREEIMQIVATLEDNRIRLQEVLMLESKNTCKDFLDLKNLKDSVYQAMIRIQQFDTANKEMAERKVEEYKMQVRQIRQSTTMVRAYATPFSRGDGTLIDKKK